MSSTTESQTAISLARPASGTAPQSIQMSAWEWEGGQLRDDATRPAPSAGPHATLPTAAGARHS